MINKTVSIASYIWVLWFFVCLYQVFVEESHAYLSERVNAAQQYKSECLESGGSIRHSDTFLTSNLYCQEHSGNETVFLFQSSVSLGRFSLVLFDRMSFGLFYKNEIETLRNV